MIKNSQKIVLKEKVSIIVINYKSEKPLLSCLKSIYNELGSKKILETIVVNNGTGDSELLKKISSFPNITFIEAGSNIGFAAGVNLGIKVAKNNLVLLLNPDTLVKLNSISLLANCLKKNKAGIAGGVNYRFDRGRHNTFVRRPNIFTYLFDYTNLRKLVPGDHFHKKHYYLDEPYPVDKKNVGAVSGSFMLIDKKVINKIGFFDERYFMYLEDIDYCLRANEAGFKVLLCPKSTIKHVGGYSSKNKERVHVSAWLESRRRYVLKHENLLVNSLIQPLFLIDAAIIRILQKCKIIKSMLYEN